MTRLSGAVRALGALLVLLAAVVGAPILLWQWGRPLLFEHLPSPAELWSSLWQQDTGGAAFMALLVVLGVAAWAVFTFCVVLDVVARVMGRRRTWRIPGLRVPQTAASALLTVILTGGLMVGSMATATAAQPLAAAITAATASPPTANSPAPLEPATETEPATKPSSSVGQKTWTVQRYDTLSSIAEQTLGDWQLYPQLVQLNVDVPQPDGRTLKDADTPLQIGWVLTLPDDAAVPTPEPTPASTDQEITVHPGDTLSSIALDTLGSADRYPELAQRNSLTDPDQLEVGQIIQIPAEPAPADHTPTADQPPADPAANLASAEAGAAPADSETTSAGQDIPPSPESPLAAAPSLDSPPTQDAPAADIPTGNAEPDVAAPSEQVQQTPPPAMTIAADPTAAAAVQSTQTASAGAADTGETTGAVAEQPTSALSAAIGIGSIGAALAGAAWLGLGLARRRRGRRRPAAKIPVTVGLDAARMQRRLREQAATVDIMWMDHALRCAAALSRGRDTTELPDVTCVWLSGSELELELATPVPAPEPFQLVDSSWVLSADAVLPELDTGAAAPFPALSTMGDQDGETLLVDLERLGSVTITGAPDRTASLLRHLAVEYAFNSWADHLQITLVGWGADLIALNPDRLRHVATATDVIATVRGRIQETAQAERDGQTTVLHGRVDESVDSDDAWVPEILLVDQTITDQESAALADALTEAPGGNRAAVAVIVRAPDAIDPLGAVINITADGRLTMPAVLGQSQHVNAAGMNQAQIQAIVESFAAVDVFRVPGPVNDTEAWAKDMDVTGALIPADDVPANTSGSEIDEPDIADRADAQDAGDHLATAGDASAVGQNVVRLPSAAAYAALQAVLADDPALDTDLQEWHSFPPGQFEVWQQELALMASADPGKELRARGGITSKDWVRRPRIGVLGEPMVLANGRMPTDRWGRFTEMCVYLALHKQVTADKFADNLWPQGTPPTGETRRSDVSRCRSWMGTDPDGRKYLPDARNRPYQLNRLLDIELFRRLRKRADAKASVGDTTGAIDDLTAGLNLVRGPVLAESPRDAYSWLTVSDPADLRAAPFMVISTAHHLVELALDAGELDLARWAADLAHLVHPDDDQPLVDLMRISHQAGDDAAARGWAATILQANRVELVEDLGNFETFVAVNEIFPQGLRAPTG